MQEHDQGRDVTPQELLAAYRARVRTVAEALRVLGEQSAPGASETVQRGWKTIGYAHSHIFCSIMPVKAGVNLVFREGAELPDPHGMLAGTGGGMRHVRIAAGEEIRSPELTDLIRAAAARGR